MTKLKQAMGLDTNNQELKVENATNGVISYKGQKYQVDDYGGVAEYVPMWIQNKTTVTKDEVTLEVGQAVTGYSVTATIGEEEKMINNWYVLGAKDGKLLITTDTCPEKVTLSGKAGYAQGIATLNLVTAKYNNSTLTDESARAITVDDINRVTGYNPNIAKYDGNYERKYGNEVTVTVQRNQSENLQTYEQGTIYPTDLTNRGSQTFEYWNGKKWITYTGITEGESASAVVTFYSYYPETLTNRENDEPNGITKESKAWKLLFSNSGTDGPSIPEGAYWLGSGCIDIYLGNWGLFGFSSCMRMISAGKISAYGLVNNSEERGITLGIRPVATLKPDIKVTQGGEISN